MDIFVGIGKEEEKNFKNFVNNFFDKIFYRNEKVENEFFVVKFIYY